MVLHDRPLEVREESTEKPIYFLSIFCMRLLIDLHLQVTNVDSGCAATPAQRLLYSLLRCLLSDLLFRVVHHPFGEDKWILLSEERPPGLRSSLYFVYVSLP